VAADPPPRPQAGCPGLSPHPEMTYRNQIERDRP
jgi:hypothetical protein